MTTSREWIARRMPGLWPGGALALASAALFGASTPFAKVLLGTIDVGMLAGLLYLGSGLGLFVVRIARRAASVEYGEKRLDFNDWPWLSGAVLAGGIIGPLSLMAGLALTPASTASLLLTLEGVFNLEPQRTLAPGVSKGAANLPVVAKNPALVARPPRFAATAPIFPALTQFFPAPQTRECRDKSLNLHHGLPAQWPRTSPIS